MVKTNTIEILQPSTSNRSPLGTVFDAKLMPANKHIYVISDGSPNAGDVFAARDLPELFGTSAIGSYETHQHTAGTPTHQQSGSVDFEGARDLVMGQPS